ncbi:hypothetical protein RchiOBHm_Chr2g0104421 [Rosa chinensis]|uniref:Uncharacterized protein n=1 Tax=Rosa chinensis TaxID=74649 RepID=A0A2P6RN54_ROSCH|nr:hypothetical protein RchiOBHm_Chr2g0104421 [Rosa chinensis]
MNQIRCEQHHQYSDANSPPLLYPNLTLTRTRVHGLFCQPLSISLPSKPTAKASLLAQQPGGALCSRSEPRHRGSLASFVSNSSVKCREIEVEDNGEFGSGSYGGGFG